MTDIRTSLPIPTQPWEAARERLIQGLLPHERDLYSNATLENLFYDASTSQKTHARGSRVWRLQERLSPLIESLEDYGKAMDVYVNTYPLVLSPLWGSLRIILLIVAEATKFQESLVDMLAQIGDVLPRFRIYEKLFRNHERLLVALSKVYFDVLQFCIASKDLFMKARRSKISLSIVLRGMWKFHLSEFDAYMAKFRAHSKRVEKEAGLAHIIESARVRDIEIQNRALQLRNAKYEKRNRILASLPAVDYLNKQSKLSASKHPGTCEWLRGTPEVAAWYAQPSSHCICCYGIPGSGKSVLAACLRDSLSEETANNNNEFVCFYYCDYSDKPSLQMSYILGSLVKQALEHLHLDQFAEDFSCPYKDDRDPPNYDEGIRYLLGILSAFDVVYLILDGIDELIPATQTQLLSLIDRLMVQASRKVKIFVTSRTEEFRIRKSLRQYPAIHLTSTYVDNDISLFIKEEISKISAPNPVALNHGLRDEVVQNLVKGAKGMFLWAKFQLADIEEALTLSDLRTILENLPESLSDTYSRIISRTAQSPGSQAKFDMMRKVFRWIAVARRPLRIYELEEAIALQPTDTYLHTDRVPKDAGSKLISCCSNLVILNDSDQTVVFAHYTVEQFIFSTQGESTEMSRLINLTPIDDEVGEICLAYLSFSDFETQLVKAPTQIHIEAPLADALVVSSVPFGRHVKNLLTRYTPWTARSQSSRAAPVKIALPSTSKPTEVLNKKYTLLEYVIENWAYHSCSLKPSTEAWPRFRHLALYRQLDFEFRPWNDSLHLKRVEAVADFIEEEVRQMNLDPEKYFSSGWRNQVAIYAWAMIHDVRPLLGILDSNNFYFYLFKAFPGSLPHYYFQLLTEQTGECFDAIPTNSRQSTGWNGTTVARILRAVSSKKDNGSLDVFRLPGVDLRNIFTYEMVHWVGKTTWAALLVDAAPIAVQAGHMDVFDYIWHGLESGSRVKDLDWQSRSKFEAIEALLCACASHLSGGHLERDIIYIVHHYLNPEELQETIKNSATCKTNARISQMLLVILMASKQPISRIVQVWKDLDLPVDDTGPFDPMGNRDLSTFWSGGEMLNVRPFLSIKVLELIEELADLKSVTSHTSIDEPLVKEILSIVAVWDKYARCFSIGIFENDSIGLLKWAIKRRRIDAVSALVPLYQEYAKEGAGPYLVRSLHTEAETASEEMLEVLSPLWDFKALPYCLDTRSVG